MAPTGVAISHVGYTFAYRGVARVGKGPELGLGDAAVLVAVGFGPFNPRGGFAADARELGAYGLAVFQRHNLTTAALVVAYATGYALTRRTLPLAGAGPVEVLLPLALTWVSYPLDRAVLAVVAYRVFNLWLTKLPSAAALRHLRHPGRRVVVERAR